jgi:hypothetical protein
LGERSTRGVTLGDTSDAKIGEPGDTVGTYEEVVGRDVAMNEVEALASRGRRFVGSVEAPEEVDPDPHGDGGGERSSVGEQRRKRLTFHKIKHKEERLRQFNAFVNLDDVWMANRTADAPLAEEIGDERFVIAKVGMKHLQRARGRRTAEARGAIDGRHPAASENSLQAISANRAQGISPFVRFGSRRYLDHK